MTQPPDQRRFCVRGVTETATRALIVAGLSFEDAALHFLEDHSPPADEGGEVSLYVDDIETGERHCFRIDLETGEATTCD